MGRKILSILILLVILLSNVKVLANDNEINYTKYVDIVRDNYRTKNNGRTFETPTPIFTTTVNGDTYTVKPFIKPYKEGERQIPDRNLYTDSRLIEPHITVPMGAVIDLEDISVIIFLNTISKTSS